jgi:flagellar protein FlbD
MLPRLSAEQKNMIRLTRLNHVPLVVNSDLIEHIEITPDTVIVLTTGQKFMVLESADEVIERVVKFRRRLLEGLTCPPASVTALPASATVSNE